jgi:hypothetical protein
MATAHGSYGPPDPYGDYHDQIGAGVWWHCYLCSQPFRTEDEAQRHFIRQHPRELLQWYESVAPLIQAAAKL